MCVCLARIASTFGTRSNVVEVTFEFMATIVCVYFMANGWKTIVHSTQLLFTEIKLLRMLEGESEREKMLFGQRAYLDQPQCRHFRCCAILSIEKRKKLFYGFALHCLVVDVLCCVTLASLFFVEFPSLNASSIMLFYARIVLCAHDALLFSNVLYCLIASTDGMLFSVFSRLNLMIVACLQFCYSFKTYYLENCCIMYLEQ